jgi:hypothetical protein
MLPGLPACRRVVRACSWALLALAVAGPAAALEITTLTAARDDAGNLWVTTRLADPIESRVEKSLMRGMPANLQLHVELWRRRGGWFDRMERSVDAAVRLRYDVWSEEWRLERSNTAPVLLGSMDSLEAALSAPLQLEVPGLDRVPAGARCYVVVTVTMKPLSVEDVREVEGWLSGEVRDQGHSGFGVVTQLPRSLFDAVRNFTGFGDSHDRATTPEFDPEALPVVERGR